MKIGMKLIGTMGALIGTYLAVAYATGLGKVITSAGTAGEGIVKRLQGR